MIRPFPALLVATLLTTGSVRSAPIKASHRDRAAPAAAVARANRAATLAPTAPGFVNATQVYPFADGAIFQLFLAPERVTDIALQPGEALVAVASGDTARWVIGDTASGSGATRQTHILAKPFAVGLRTNLVITTDRRTYHLALASTRGAAMAAISWTYPADALLALRAAGSDQIAAPAPVPVGIDPAQLNFGYAITGANVPWRPLRAFDDGHQTYIEFPASLGASEAPPLFLVGRSGAAELVNYRLRGHYYVVDRLFDAAELRIGGKEASTVRVARQPARTERGS